MLPHVQISTSRDTQTAPNGSQRKSIDGLPIVECVLVEGRIDDAQLEVGAHVTRVAQLGNELDVGKHA